MSDFWFVPLTAEQRRILRRLIRDEAHRLGVKEGMEPDEWPSGSRTRLRKLRTILNKMSDVRPDYRAKV